MAKENAELGLDPEDDEKEEKEDRRAEDTFSTSVNVNHISTPVPQTSPPTEAGPPFTKPRQPLQSIPIPDIGSLSLNGEPKPEASDTRPSKNLSSSSTSNANRPDQNAEDGDSDHSDDTGPRRTPLSTAQPSGSATPLGANAGQPEISKRDKRRAREAAKKAKEAEAVNENTTVQVRSPLKFLSTGPCDSWKN